jgi:ABC-type sugar transport system ATPase subunit
VSASAGRAQVTVAGHAFDVAVAAEQLIQGQAVHMGMRPEHMRLAPPDSSANSLAAQVVHIEKLGEASLLYLALTPGTPTITLKVEGTTTLRPGENIRVQVAAEDLHLFDTQGQALSRTVSLPV